MAETDQKAPEKKLMVRVQISALVPFDLVTVGWTEREIAALDTLDEDYEEAAESLDQAAYEYVCAMDPDVVDLQYEAEIV